MIAKSFRDLTVWQQGIELTAQVYKLTSTFPKQELYGLTSQMCRAAVSIPSNIAEGSARSSKREYRHFVLIARGSANELQTQLIIARRLEYGRVDVLDSAEALCLDVGRMLNGLANFLRDQILASIVRPGLSR